jgi:hypothetical protein
MISRFDIDGNALCRLAPVSKQGWPVNSAKAKKGRQTRDAISITGH